GLLVSLAYETDDLAHFESLIEKGGLLIFFDRVFDHPQCTSIIIDNVMLVYELTQPMTSQDCRLMAQVTVSHKRNVYADRLKGFKQALNDHGLSFDEGLLFENNLSEQVGVDVSKSLLSMDQRPDAIFTSNDACAVSLIREFKQAGLRIPHDIAIAGF